MYYLCECLIIKDENHYLIEHLTHSFEAGIEHVYIYDNESESSVENFLKDYPEFYDKCTVEVFKTTSDKCQVDCYSKFIEDHRNDTKWVTFIDTDEMLEGNLKQLCEENEDYFSLRIHQVVHGANGQAYADFTKTMTERFKDHVTSFPMVKMCVKTEYLEKQSPHHSFMNGKASEKSLEFWLKNIDSNNSICQLHHYFYKSFEEWLIKVVKRGSVISAFTWDIDKFFIDNEIPESDKLDLLKKYNIDLNINKKENGNN